MTKQQKELLSERTNEHVYHCAKCGLCLDACPVYKELLVESASPRGKVQLAKHIIEGDLEISKKMEDILFSQCLLCGSCVIACPSGVKQNELFSGLRWRTAQRHGMPLAKKLFFQVLSRRWLMSTSSWFGKWVRKIFSGPAIESRIEVGNLPVSAIPPLNDKPFNAAYPEIVMPEDEIRARILYFHGCATNYVFADVGKAVVSVLTNMGVQVEIPRGQSCCGLPIFLSGDRKTAIRCITEALGLFARDDVDAVIVDCATCGSALRHEYAHILRELKDLGEDVSEDMIEKAQLLQSKVRDVSEYVAAHMDWLAAMPSRDGARKIRVAYHDPCHLMKGQGVTMQPRTILKSIPSVEYVEMEKAGTCCGGGGEFQIEFGDTSALITNRKIGYIHDANAQILATGCPGCNITIRAHLDKNKNMQVLHTIQVLQKSIDGTLDNFIDSGITAD
ncbi:MAG: (Fe-S)-binding protein [Deltaproteobacteria bacterium]|nr:(Fe-S)-binding protein [Deltaproteobacteria bacterium]